jgi:hypothetical protein
VRLARASSQFLCLACLPICLPSVMGHPDRRRTPTDSQHAPLKPEPQAGRQWHGSGRVRTPGVPPTRTEPIRRHAMHRSASLGAARLPAGQAFATRRSAGYVQR